MSRALLGCVRVSFLSNAPMPGKYSESEGVRERVSEGVSEGERGREGMRE